VDVTHIVNRGRRVGVESLDVSVDILSTRHRQIIRLIKVTYVGSSSGTREALKARGLNGPPEKALI
jgi:hypothetical protein